MASWILIDSNGERVTDQCWDHVHFVDPTFVTFRTAEKKYGVVDAIQNRVRIQPDFDEIRTFRGDIASARIGNERGLLRRDGSRVGEWNFDYIGPVIEGFAVASVNGKKGMIDENANWILPPNYWTVDRMSEGMFTAANDVNQYEYFTSAGTPLDAGRFELAQPFREGFAYVRSTDVSGFIDLEGDVALDGTHLRRAAWFSEGLAYCYTQDAPGRVSYIDLECNLAFQRNFNDGQPFSGGLASVQVGDRWGAIDRAGNMVISPEYETVGRCTEGLVPVARDGQYGYLTATGQVAIPFQFDIALPFSQGFAAVSIPE